MNNTTQKMSPVKMALMELTMLGEYGVSDRVGICEFIERMDENQIEDLAKDVIMLEDNVGCKTLLESKYNEELQKQNTRVCMTESLFSSRRDNIILQEAEGDHIDLQGAIKTGGAMGGTMWVIKMSAENPPEAHAQMTNLRVISSKMYETIADKVATLTHGKIIFPTMKRTTRALDKLSTALKKAGSEYKDLKGNTLVSTQDEIIMAKQRLKDARLKDITGLKKRYGNAIRHNGAIILAMMGLTGLAILANHIYQKYLSDAAKHCRGKQGVAKDICVSTFKIEACEAAIQKCREALGSCKDKPNPEKCTHSIQTQIWNWERRKRKYQQRIAARAKQTVAKPPHHSTLGPEDQPSKKSKKSGGVSVF